MAQGIFLHEYDTGGKLYDGAVTDANNKLANKQYVIDNAFIQSNNLSELSGSAGTARSNLGLAIGSDVQAFSAKLDALAALAVTDSGFIVGNGSTFVLETAEDARTSLGLGTAAVQNTGIGSGDILAAAADVADNDFLRIDGSSVEGLSSAEMMAALSGAAGAAFAMNSQKITGLADPTDAQDAATKAYVDGVKQGLDIKESVRVATTASGTLASSFANGQTVDGVTLATGDRILIKNQSTASENGVYTVNASGAPTRAADFDSAADVTSGAFLFVEQGSTNADSGFVLTTDGGAGGPDTSSRYTGFDALFGSATSIDQTGLVLDSATYTTTSASISFTTDASCTSIGDTIPENSILIFSNASGDTLAYRVNGFTIQNGFQSVSTVSGSNLIYERGQSTVETMNTSDVTAMSFKTQTQVGLKMTINQAALTHETTSIFLEGGFSWDGGSVPAGKYIEFTDSGNKLYYKTSSALANGDAAISVEADTSNSDASTWNIFPGPGGPSMNFFDAGLSVVTPGTSDLSFTQFSGAGQLTAGDGLQKSGNTISADLKANGGLVIESGEIAVDLAGSSITGTLAISDGGTGATTAAAARTALQVDVAGTDNSTDVTLAGKDYASISGQEITFAQIDLTDDVSGVLPVANGGTGSATAPMVGVITAADAAAARTVLSAQAADAELSALAGLTSAADKGIMFNGSESATTFDLTQAGRDLLDDADAAAMRATLGLVIGTDVAAADSTELSVTTSEPSSIAIGDVDGMYVYDISANSTALTVDLPSTATAGCLGKSVIFKIKSTVGTSSSLTISGATNQTIDGESSIVLNQERQAIKLVISEEHSSGATQCWVVV